MKTFSEDEYKTKIFITKVPSIVLDDIAKETLLVVMKTGSVILYSTVPEYSFYFPEGAKNSDPRANRDKNSQRNDQKRFNGKSSDQNSRAKNIIKCIRKLNFVQNSNQIEIHFNPSTSILSVSGFFHKNVPSVGIFRVTANDLEPLHIESLSGAVGVEYNGLNNTVIILPRSMNGSILSFKYNKKPDEPFLPEYIPRFVVSCYGTKRASHMRINPVNQYMVLTWSDDLYPFIAINTLKDLTWQTEAYHFTEEAFIQQVEFDSTGQKIGLVISKSFSTIISIWTLGEDKIIQRNFSFDDNLIIESAKWMPCTLQTSAFCIWTKTGMLEANGKKVYLWTIDTVRSMQFTISSGGFHVYFDRNGIFEVGSKKVIDKERESAPETGEKVSAFPLIKAVVSGKCFSANGVHMQRCMNCRRPLMYPLVSSDEGISACYCSAECQLQHWPLYFASRQPLSFE